MIFAPSTVLEQRLTSNTETNILPRKTPNGLSSYIQFYHRHIPTLHIELLGRLKKPFCWECSQLPYLAVLSIPIQTAQGKRLGSPHSDHNPIPFPSNLSSVTSSCVIPEFFFLSVPRITLYEDCQHMWLHLNKVHEWQYQLSHEENISRFHSCHFACSGLLAGFCKNPHACFPTSRHGSQVHTAALSKAFPLRIRISFRQFKMLISSLCLTLC